MNLSPLLQSVSEQNLHILNLVVRQHGEIIAGYDFAEEQPVLLWSVSKTFTSMAVGLAAQEGYFDIHDKLLRFFPQAACEGFNQLTIRDLLCMGTGQEKDPFNQTYQAGQSLDDAERIFFSEPICHTPGTFFLYNNAATYLLSSLVSLATGNNLLAFLTPRVFQPLGIRDVRWEQNANGINFGCSGLYLKAHDLSLFGQLLLNEGAWQGRQLIPAAYMREATRPQLSTADFNEPFATADHTSGYGYQLWMNRIPGTYRLDGLYGQYVVVLPQQDAVVTFVSNEPEKMTAILELTWKFLVNQL
jgi:CubicO group peptidase (beta-lactamase class C family)